MEELTPAHVQRVLDTFSLGLTVEHFDADTSTSETAAAAIGCNLGQIAKSLCFLTDGRPLLVVASGDKRIAEAKLARHLGIGRKKIKLAPALVCIDLLGYAPGGVPPVAHRSADIPVVIDETLARWERIYAAAGTAHDNFGLTFDQLVAISGGSVIDCVVDRVVDRGVETC